MKRPLRISLIFLTLAVIGLVWLWWLGGHTFIPSWKETGQRITKWSLILLVLFTLLFIVFGVIARLRSGSKRTAWFWLRLCLGSLLEFAAVMGIAIFLLLTRFSWVEYVPLDEVRYDDGTELYLHHRSGFFPGDHPKDYVLWSRDGSLPFMNYVADADTGSGSVTLEGKTYRFSIREKNGIADLILEK